MANHQTFLAVKGVERDGDRWIEGWATTGKKDRVSDIVVPEGAVFTLPIPLLFAHKHDEPIGSVTQASVTRAGIRIRARLTVGVARAEEVWKLILDGALTACSIGFQALKSTPLSDGGIQFDQWSWYELSIVSVGANPDSKISVAKCVALAAPQSQKEVTYIPKSTRNTIDPVLLGKELAGVIKQATGPLEKRIAQLEKGGPGFDAEEFGKAVGAGVRKVAERLEKRIAELESRQSGMMFMGEFQDALSYPSGAVVKHSGELYCAIRDVTAGKTLPGRHGSGWTKMS